LRYVNTGLFAPRTFCFQEQGPRSKNSVELSFPGTIVPSFRWTFCTLELLFTKMLSTKELLLHRLWKLLGHLWPLWAANIHRLSTFKHFCPSNTPSMSHFLLSGNLYVYKQSSIQTW